MFIIRGAGLRERIVPYATLLLLCGATALPLLGAQTSDSFPISTYPMFAAHRGQPTFHRLVAVMEDGSRKTVPPELVASAEVLQTKVIITRAVKRGKKAMRRLCNEVAQNISRDAQFATAHTVQIEEVRFDSIRYFTEGTKPVSSKILGACPAQPRSRP